MTDALAKQVKQGGLNGAEPGRMAVRRNEASRDRGAWQFSCAAHALGLGIKAFQPLTHERSNPKSKRAGGEGVV